MFTVVIAEQKLLDSLEEYELFLRPFREATNVVFCPWATEQARLCDAVPDLPRLIAGKAHWRAIVVCDERGLAQRNPFDLISCVLPERTEDMSAEEHMRAMRSAKFAAYEKAAELPLPRLMTYLCESPQQADRTDVCAEPQDLALREYREESRKKQALRAHILSTASSEFTLPQEVICVARRTCKVAEYAFREAWETHHDVEYSTFYDRNLYFDKMRYVLYDLLPRNHEEYASRYVSFLYALLLFASNALPQGSMRPNRVYRLSCENDEKALCALVQRYDTKLAATERRIEERIREEQEEKSTEKQKDALCKALCREVHIPVSSFGENDLNEIYFRVEQIGLANDVPVAEYGLWSDFFQNAKKRFLRHLKTPRRALEKGTHILRELNQVDAQQIHSLDHFQREDILCYTLSEEEKMTQVKTVDLHDPKVYLQRMQTEDRTIRDNIRKRMSRKMIAVATLLALFVFVIGYLPFLLTNRTDAGGLASALTITGIAFGLFLLTAYVCLWLFRWKLRRRTKHYNQTMLEILNEVEDASVKYGEYLSHACNVMRGNAALNYYSEHEAPGLARHRVMRKHIADIRKRRCELREFFAELAPEEPLTDETDVFEFDFSKPLEFSYPIPFAKDGPHRMEFLQSGNFVDAPVDFVKCMQLRREELYD